MAKMPTQPHTITAGPPLCRPNPKSVMPPARTQMTEKEMA
jgi:hypothetical protein